MDNKEVRCRKVDSPQIARALLKKGHRIHDIKPLKGDVTRTRTSFLFEYTDALQQDLNSLVEERQVSYTELVERGIEIGIIPDE